MSKTHKKKRKRRRSRGSGKKEREGSSMEVDDEQAEQSMIFSEVRFSSGSERYC